MGLIQDLIRKKKDIKEEKESYERGKHVEENFEQKKMSSNERELLRYKNQEREKAIKQELEHYRKRENDKFWSGHKNNPADAPNVVAGQKEIFKGKDDLFAKKTEAFKQPDLFFKGRGI